MKTRLRTTKDNRQAPNKVLEWLAAHNPISRLDRYIIGKFLGTYFFSIALIISIAVVFDFNENIDKFLSRNAPISAILFDSGNAAIKNSAKGFIDKLGDVLTRYKENQIEITV